jgi:hypothetical protein
MNIKIENLPRGKNRENVSPGLDIIKSFRKNYHHYNRKEVV